jgi:hypothetical protein
LILFAFRFESLAVKGLCIPYPNFLLVAP